MQLNGAHEIGYVNIEKNVMQNNKAIDYVIFGVDTLEQAKEVIGKFNGTDNISESFVAKIKDAFSDTDERTENPNTVVYGVVV